MGPYVFRICIVLGNSAASLYLALVCSVSRYWMVEVHRGSKCHRLFKLIPAELQHYSLALCNNNPNLILFGFSFLVL